MADIHRISKAKCNWLIFESCGILPRQTRRRAIHRKLGFDRETIRKAITNPAQSRTHSNSHELSWYLDLTNNEYLNCWTRAINYISSSAIPPIACTKFKAAKATRGVPVRCTILSAKSGENADEGKPTCRWNSILTHHAHILELVGE